MFLNYFMNVYIFLLTFRNATLILEIETTPTNIHTKKVGKDYG